MALDDAPPGQFVDLGLLDAGREPEVEFLERLDRREAGQARPPALLSDLPSGRLGLAQRLQEVAVGARVARGMLRGRWLARGDERPVQGVAQRADPCVLEVQARTSGSRHKGSSHCW